MRSTILKELDKKVKDIFIYDYNSITRHICVENHELKNDDILETFYNEDNEDEVNIDLSEFIKAFLQQKKDKSDIISFDVDEATFFDSPGYETGMVMFSFITKENELVQSYYQWEYC